MKIQELKIWLKQICSAIAELCKTSYMKSKQAQAQIQQNYQQQQAYAIACDIQNELYQVMAKLSYPLLAPLHMPSDIRIYDIRHAANNRFSYAVVCMSNTPASGTHLTMLHNNINADIDNFRYYLSMFGTPQNCAMCPYIFQRRLFVSHIQAITNYIIITVEYI